MDADEPQRQTTKFGEWHTYVEPAEEKAYTQADDWITPRKNFTQRTLEVYRARERIERNELLRASCASVVLAKFGRILQSAEGSADTYALSEHVSKLDIFISHNWSTERVPKFLVLAMHFNFSFSVFFTGLSMISISALMCLEILAPAVTIPGENQLLIQRQSIWNTMFANWIFIVFLLFRHEISVFNRFLGDDKCFLDKTCIHQTDEELKQQGICSLGVFLNASERMLVVYRETYLHKIWTVFELASFIAVHPERDIILIPTSMPCFFFVIVLLDYVCLIMRALDDFLSEETSLLTRYIIPMSCQIATCIFQRRIARDRSRVSEQAESFDIRHAQCMNESDRAFVEGGVIALMKYIERVPQDEDDDRALDSFNELVAKELPLSLDNCFGRVGMRYHHVIALRFSRLAWGLDKLCYLWHARQGARAMLVESLGIAAWFLCFHPLTFALNSWVAAQGLCLSGGLDLAVSLAVGSGLAVVEVRILATQFKHLVDQAYTSNEALLVFFVLAFVMLMLTHRVYRMRNRRASEKHRITVEMTLLNLYRSTKTSKLERRDSATHHDGESPKELSRKTVNSVNGDDDSIGALAEPLAADEKLCEKMDHW